MPRLIKQNPFGTTIDASEVAADVATQAELDAVSARVMVIFAGGGNVSSTVTPQFYRPNADLNGVTGSGVSSTGRMRVPLRQAGTLQNFNVLLAETAIASGETITATVWRNGVATALTVTLTDATSVGSLTLSAGPLSVSANDLIEIELAVTSGPGQATTYIAWSLEYVIS